MAELGRQPYTARAFFYVTRAVSCLARICFPMWRCIVSTIAFWKPRTIIDYPSHASRQGRWRVHGLYLPPEVLQQIYRDNALALLHLQ